MRSSVTISLVAEGRGGPFVFWDDLAASVHKAANLGFDGVEVFPPGPQLFPGEELRRLLDATGLKLAAVGTGAGWVIRKLTLTHADAGHRAQARQFVRDLIDRAGRIADDRYFGVLSDGEIARYEALERRDCEYPQARPLSDEEQSEFDAIRDHLWRSWLPTLEAVRELTRAAVALPDENDAAWKVLEACGISRGGSSKQ